MTIQTRTWLYETLIRFDEKGYSGSQQIRMQTVWDDETGEVLAERELPAEPISDPAIAALVGEQVLVMGRQIEVLEAELAKLRAGEALPSA